MEFWNNIVGVSEEAARMQVSIISRFPASKKAKIAYEFSNFGIAQTRDWIKSKNPWSSELEINLEYVRTMYYDTGEMTEDIWRFYESTMIKKIKKDWSNRFKLMMKDKNLSYTDIAKMIDSKSENSVKSTISRGLPAFAKLSVILHELSQSTSINSQNLNDV